jgi:DNA polymerase/3'-5' exonuclease PolX
MFPHSFAREIAEDFINQISAACDRIEIVGSLRRLKVGVNDIDILAIPRFIQADDDTLFGEPVQENQLDKQLSELCLSRDLELDANGSKIKRFLKTVDGDMVPIDLYIATEQTWWTLLLIRTGSRNHNIKLARRAMELQMHLKADGTGLLTGTGSIIPIASEEEIFRHLRLEYRSPEEREY